MIRSYLKVARRNLRKQKVFVVGNAIGMSTVLCGDFVKLVLIALVIAAP
jgi:hypothetical protein